MNHFYCIEATYKSGVTATFMHESVCNSVPAAVEEWTETESRELASVKAAEVQMPTEWQEFDITPSEVKAR